MRPIEHERCRTAYYSFLAAGLQDHQGNMWATIVWANGVLRRKQPNHTNDEDYYLIKAIHELTPQDVNKIIHELTISVDS